MTKNTKYTWADSWLLLSIIYASGNGRKPASLAEIIGHGDFINHAIFTLSELRGGFYRLLKEKYIVERGEYFLPSDKTLSLYLSYIGDKKRTNVRKDEAFIDNILNATEWSKDYDCSKADLDGRYERINEKLTKTAYHDYVKMLKKGNI